MKKVVLLIFIVCLFAACNNNNAEPVKEAATESKEEKESNFVSLTDRQIKVAGIELGTIELKNLKTSIKANGLLSVPNQNKAFVTSLSSGVIKTLLIHPGSFVRKGQAVATIINPDIAALQQQLQSVNAQIGFAQIEYNRQKELVAGNAAPLKNVQRLQSELSTLQSLQHSLQKQLAAMGISASSVSNGRIVTTLTITAPISGTVSNVASQIGSNVNPSTPIAEIVNNSLLHLDLFVFEKDLPKLHVNQSIHFILTNNPGKEYDAQIYSIGAAFANESKTIPVHAEVKGDKKNLIEGMSITALISIGENVVPAVPTDAIVSYGGQDYIFVPTNAAPPLTKEAGEGNAATPPSTTYERVQVMKGMSDVGFTEITLIKNLPPNTPIVAKGAFFVLAKMTNISEEE